MIWQDPPYNVDYANTAKDKKRGTHRPILNDNLGEGFQGFLLAALQPAASGPSSSSGRRTPLRSGGPIISDSMSPSFTVGVKERHTNGVMTATKGDVWFFNKPTRNDLHPTMKPVELVERAIRNSSRPGELMLDCFGGSGSTLIAAEKSGRQARLMELDPKYCDVIVRRWQDWTGKQAILAGCEQTFAEVALQREAAVA